MSREVGKPSPSTQVSRTPEHSSVAGPELLTGSPPPLPAFSLRTASPGLQSTVWPFSCSPHFPRRGCFLSGVTRDPRAAGWPGEPTRPPRTRRRRARAAWLLPRPRRAVPPPGRPPPRLRLVSERRAAWCLRAPPPGSFRLQEDRISAACPPQGFPWVGHGHRSGRKGRADQRQSPSPTSDLVRGLTRNPAAAASVPRRRETRPRLRVIWENENPLPPSASLSPRTLPPAGLARLSRGGLRPECPAAMCHDAQLASSSELTTQTGLSWQRAPGRRGEAVPWARAAPQGGGRAEGAGLGDGYARGQAGALRLLRARRGCRHAIPGSHTHLSPLAAT